MLKVAGILGYIITFNIHLLPSLRDDPKGSEEMLVSDGYRWKLMLKGYP